MTYRERREAKAERLRGWAAKRQTSASATLRASEVYRGDHAFNTQPGHIPERARVIARKDRAFESLDKARSMDARADEIERQADNAIYSDDPDAIERLRDKIAALEHERERIKAVNTAIRRRGFAGGICNIEPPLTATERTELLSIAAHSPYHQVEKRGFPAYKLQNLGGNINRLRGRLKDLQDRAENGPPLRYLVPRFAGECATCGVKVDKGAVAYYRKPDLFCSVECSRGTAAAQETAATGADEECSDGDQSN